MIRTPSISRSLLLICGLLLTVTPCITLAEVSTSDSDTESSSVSIFIAMRVAGGEDPGPWPVWKPIRTHVRDELHLNREGESNQDGTPAFAIHPETGFPVVTWAWFDGEDFEIALSTWNGSQWSPWELLTDNTEDDLDPRVSYSPGGQRQVCWWHDGSTSSGIDDSWHRQQDPLTDTWSEATLVSQPDGQGSYPDVCSWGSEWIYASYQLDDDGREGPHRVMVTWRERDGVEFSEQLEIAISDYTGELPESGSRINIQARVHSSGGQLWVDWIQDHDQMGYSIYESPGVWSAPEYLNYRSLVELAGSYEAGLDMSRQEVRGLVTH